MAKEDVTKDFHHAQILHEELPVTQQNRTPTTTLGDQDPSFRPQSPNEAQETILNKVGGGEPLKMRFFTYQCKYSGYEDDLIRNHENVEF